MAGVPVLLRSHPKRDGASADGHSAFATARPAPTIIVCANKEGNRTNPRGYAKYPHSGGNTGALAEPRRRLRKRVFQPIRWKIQGAFGRGRVPPARPIGGGEDQKGAQNVASSTNVSSRGSREAESLSQLPSGSWTQRSSAGGARGEEGRHSPQCRRIFSITSARPSLRSGARGSMKANYSGRDTYAELAASTPRAPAITCPAKRSPKTIGCTAS